MLVFKLNVGRLECCRFVFFFIPFRTATGSIQFNYLSCLNGSCQDNEQNGAGNKTEWETRGKLNRWQAIQVIAINSWCDKNPTNMKNARCGSVEYVQLDTGIVRIFPLTTVTKNGVKHHKMFQQIFCVAMISFHVYLWGGGDAADRQLTTCVTIFVFECRSNRMSDNYHNWNEKVTRMWTWQKVSSYGNGWTEMHQFQQIGYTKILLIHFEIHNFILLGCCSCCGFCFWLFRLTDMNIEQYEWKTTNRNRCKHVLPHAFQHIAWMCALVCCDSDIICLIIFVFHFSWCESVGRIARQIHRPIIRFLSLFNEFP